MASPAVLDAPHETDAQRREIHVRIIKAMHNGDSSVKACKTLGIARTTWLDWLDSRPQWADEYARARAICGEVWAQGIIDETELEPERTPDGKIDPAWVQLVRVRTDTKKWVGSKLFPRELGDKIDVTSGGEKVSGVVMLPPSNPE